MIPAKGTLQLNDSTHWEYRLAGNDSTAYVHAGWTIALGFMAPDIVKHVKELYAQGVKEFLIAGIARAAPLLSSHGLTFNIFPAHAGRRLSYKPLFTRRAETGQPVLCVRL